MSDPTRLRIVLSYTTRHWGGVLSVTKTLADGLLVRGHEVLFICRRGSMTAEHLRDVAPIEVIPGGMDFHPPSLWRAARIFSSFRPHVLLTMTRKDVRLTAPAARGLGIPVIVRHANDQPVGSGIWGRSLMGRLATAHVTNAGSTRETLLASMPSLAPDRVRVIYNGIDAPRFASAAPADLGVPAGGVAIGFVGRFEPIKGLRELADAWDGIADEHPHAHLVLVGRGSLEAWLKERLGSSDRVHFPGFRTDLPEVMRALDLLVLPSYREGAPNVALEAMAAGIPVVATNVSGTPEIVEDGVSGLLVPPRDPAALAAAIRRLLADPDLRSTMGAKGATRAATFTIDRMLDEYEAVLREFGREPANPGGGV